MRLLQLPNEVLRQVFDELGPSFVREDIRRLTISKRWFDFALPVCLRHLSVAQRALHKLVEAGPSADLESIQNHVRILDIQLTGCPIDRSDPASANSRQLSVADDVDLPNFHPDAALTIYWMKLVNNDLFKFAGIIQRSSKLHTLTLRASATKPLEQYSAEAYLLPYTVQPFLCMENLHTLVLDLHHSTLIPPTGNSDDTHLCPSIGKLLCSLRVLRLCLPCICPTALTTPSPEDSLALETLVVNLSLAADTSRAPWDRHAVRCGPLYVSSLLIRSELKTQAARLAERMVSPKAVSIVAHGLPNFHLRSHDVLRNRVLHFESDIAWDQIGNNCQLDWESESDISYSDCPVYSEELEGLDNLEW